jgi:hypothetical protein
MGTFKPILPGFTMPTYASVEQLTRRTIVTSACQEEEVARLFVLQYQTNSSFAIVRRKIVNRSYHKQDT